MRRRIEGFSTIWISARSAPTANPLPRIPPIAGATESTVLENSDFNESGLSASAVSRRRHGAGTRAAAQRGTRSGEQYVTRLLFVGDGDNYVLVGSNGGAEKGHA